MSGELVIECVAFSPHPDDAELFCGGFLLMAKKAGLRTAVVDLTAGELSTNGNPQLRAEESARAAGILGLDERRNLNIPDGNLANTFENRLKIIDVVRELQPGVCLIPYWIDRHPDHEAASRLVRDALFSSGLKKIESDQKEYRPEKNIYYMLHTPFEPDFVLDISEVFGEKMKAIQSYASQFTSDAAHSERTYINRGDFLESIEIRARYYGYLSGCRYAEPFHSQELLKLNNILPIFA